MEEESFLKISEKKRGELGVGIGLKWRLLSGMSKNPSGTLFCPLFFLELEDEEEENRGRHRWKKKTGILGLLSH